MIFEVHQYKCRYLGAPAQMKLYDERRKELRPDSV